jgi:uncharacterized membrane protein YkgB
MSPSTFDRLDARITRALGRASIPMLRISLGLVFVWFGALKLVPGASPAEALALDTLEILTFGRMNPQLALVGLAAWEVAIGLGLLVGRWLRATLLLLFVQMLGTVTPILLFPETVFTRAPLLLTLEGQYIVKNLVLVGAAMVIGATVRGGRLVTEGDEEDPGVGALPGPASRA